MDEDRIVLYVEDEESDRFLMQRAFEREGLGSALRMVSDGQAAIDYLSATGSYGDRHLYPSACVVLLDLNLPEVHGFDVLKWIRTCPQHAELPVVVFSSSERDEDQAQARRLGANEFAKKPNSGMRFVDVVRSLRERWMGGRGA